jgi:hypothetical protein
VSNAQGTGALATDRAKFKAEMDANPALKEKVLRIAANEQGKNAGGTQAVIESMMNRASMKGTSLAAQAKWTGEGGYYEQGNMGKGALENKEHAAVLNKSLEGALAGSNTTDYATDNASQGLARKRKANNEMEFTKEFNGESFFRPGRVSGQGNVNKHAAWMNRMKQQDAANPQVASTDPNVKIPGGEQATGSMADTGRVPSNVMDQARALALQGGGSADVQNFMRSKGYPKAGAWCGEFTASVVKQGGGVPPKDAAVASNWLKYGRHVDPKDVQEGDVMVRTRSRYGGPAVPGQTGSHVALVGKVGDKTVQRVGGNQGKGIVNQNRYDGEYEYRRAIPREKPAGAVDDQPKGQGAVSAEDIYAGSAARNVQPLRQPAPTEDQPLPSRSSRDQQMQVNLKVNDNEVQFARSSMRRAADREVREARWNSYSDIGAA